MSKNSVGLSFLGFRIAREYFLCDQEEFLPCQGTVGTSQLPREKKFPHEIVLDRCNKSI